MVIRISYPLNRQTPLYPGSPPIEYHMFRSLERGDTSDHSVITLSSHAGTHIDVPRHFCPKGFTVTDLLSPVTETFPAYCWDIPKEPKSVIGINDLPHDACSRFMNAQAILLRTGFWNTRKKSPDDYVLNNPWLDPEIVPFLRTHFPSLRLLGIDTISIANTSHKDSGRAAHRELLCGDPAIMILEDADLSDHSLTSGSMILRIHPIIMDETEAVPVIVFAEKMRAKN